jgi:16S rRNA (guanine(966)-N(2))-methyltransferase RsmD
MRVISGQSKGRRIKAPKGSEVRPTASRVKEAIFNILPHDLDGIRVLDLFAGSGALSMEALSRGAREAILIDISRKAAETIRGNLEVLGLSSRSRIWTMPAPAAIRRLSRAGETFDLIFIDPPYDKGSVGRVVKAVMEGGLLAEAGTLVAEHSVREAVAESYGFLDLRDRRRYGDTVVSFFSRR